MANTLKPGPTLMHTTLSGLKIRASNHFVHPELRSPMKHTTLTLLMSALLAAAALPSYAATPASPVALEVSIGGIGPGVDANAFKRVKLLVSEALYKGTIDYFDVYGYGKEGGFSACMAKGRFAVTGSFESLIKSLKAIKPNPSTTAYSVDTVEQCTYRQAAATL